jgi:4-amino-4-deoxy-L-arabinose transferase-like glycosyltransferase
MRTGQAIGPETAASRTIRLPALLLSAACAICLLPFVFKAFHIDDPLFLWSARQIRAHPGDPFGFDVNWENTPIPMVKETKNPPLTCYYLALAGTLFGWSEPALHLAFFVPALAVILGTYRLAQSYCACPTLAALVAMATPAFLISSTSLMCDTMMLAFWIWALVFWEEGIAGQHLGQLCLAGLFVGLGFLTKYFAISLLPLLLVYSLLRRKSLGVWVLPLLIPVAIMGGYLLFIYLQYRVNLAREVVGFANKFQAEVSDVLEIGFDAKLLITLAFTGGCLIPVLFFVPVLWRWQSIVAFMALGLLLVYGIWHMESVTDKLTVAGHIQPHMVLQLALFASCGLILFALAAVDLWQRRDAHSVLLCLWLGGTFFFAGFVNWTINGRSILPMAPAAGILIARRIDIITNVLGSALPNVVGWSPDQPTAPDRRSPDTLETSGRPRCPGQEARTQHDKTRNQQGETPLQYDAWTPWRFLLPLLPSFVVALWAAWADYQFARASWTAAQVLQAHAARHPGERLWFSAHWGFQYYMQENGFQAVDGTWLNFRPGDVFVMGMNNYRPPFLEVLRNCKEVARLDVPTREAVGNWSYGLRSERDQRTGRELRFHSLDIPIGTWLSVMQAKAGAGFYNNLSGPLPFAFGRVTPERYLLLQFQKRVAGGER